MTTKFCMKISKKYGADIGMETEIWLWWTQIY